MLKLAFRTNIVLLLSLRVAHVVDAVSASFDLTTMALFFEAIQAREFVTAVAFLRYESLNQILWLWILRPQFMHKLVVGGINHLLFLLTDMAYEGAQKTAVIFFHFLVLVGIHHQIQSLIECTQMLRLLKLLIGLLTD